MNKWKRFTKKNDEIIEEYTEEDPQLEESKLSTMKHNSIKNGLVIYTKWRLVGENKWQRLIRYPWNEIENEVTTNMPMEYNNDITHTPADKPDTIKEFTILENLTESTINNDETAWIDRNDGNKYWVRHRTDNNIAVRETTGVKPIENQEECEELEEYKNKDDAKKNGTVKYSKWSTRVDRNGEYKRRYITWPWGEVEREVIRTDTTKE